MSDAPAETLPPPVPADSKLTCDLCHLRFSGSEVITFGTQVICFNCKPKFVQTMREGGAAPMMLMRRGRTLIVGRRTELPGRCVKCNAPITGPKLTRKLYWHPPAYYLFIFVNLLIYVIVAMCVRKTADLQVGVCKKHLRRRRNGIAIAWISFGLMIAGILWSANSGLFAPATIGVLVFIVGLIAGSVMSTIVTPTRIDNESIWLKGVCREYLDLLPDDR